MSTVTVDDTLCTRVRDAVRTLREAEFAVREAVAALDGSDVVALSGYRSTVRLVGDLARVDQVVAKRWVGQAKLVSERSAFSGEPLEPGLPATAAVFADGTVGADHVRVIERAMDAVARVPDLGPDVVVDAEAMLAAHATQLCPRGVERAATRLLAHLDPDGVAPLDPPGLEDEVSVSTSRRDGSLALAARIHGAGDAELIREVLDALSVPAGPDDSRPLGARARRRAAGTVHPGRGTHRDRRTRTSPRRRTGPAARAGHRGTGHRGAGHRGCGAGVDAGAAVVDGDHRS